MKKLEIGCLVECDNLKDVRIMEIIVNRFALNYITNIWTSYSVEAVIDVESHTLSDSDYSEFFKDGCRAIYEVEKKGDIIYISAFDPKEIGRREVVNCKSLFEYDVVIAENNNDYARLKQESLINAGSQIRR